ncbi:pentapeptide repeat-containing protein [Streptomyces microflavus]|nr:pentapeptide repeat-containing protein [Streptomyces microflavus]QQZ52818.1 pentapeptide repeat-containing protein [Streptomyces microflavus]
MSGNGAYLASALDVGGGGTAGSAGSGVGQDVGGLQGVYDELGEFGVLGGETGALVRARFDRSVTEGSNAVPRLPLGGRLALVINPFQRRQQQDGRHPPNLWPVWLVAPGALLLVGLAAYGLYHGAELLLVSESAGKGTKPVSVQDVIKTTVTVLTLIGAVLAALYAYRKQLLDEGASHRADATQLTERYSKAAEQLGHEQAAVRLAGVYAMARLADDWPEQRQVCVDVLCAYLRMPYETDINEPGFRHGEREVRLTIIRNHLQDPTEPTTWCGHNLDFTGATFDGGDFSGARFSDGVVDFSLATFSGGVIDLHSAVFSGGSVAFTGATLSRGKAIFTGARFSGGEVYFHSVTFSGGVAVFTGARFSGGSVNFRQSCFSGGEVDFRQAEFSGASVDFRYTRFVERHVDFTYTRFSGGHVNFCHVGFFGGNARFDGLRVEESAVVSWGPFTPVPVNHP